MVRRSLTAFLVAAATFACGVPVAGANPVTACDNPADSALNQYCETVPGTGGGQVPGAGARPLAAVLPHSLIAKIVARTAAGAGSAGGRARAAALLSLPAPVHDGRQAVASSSPRARPAAAATVPLSTWAIAIVAALLLALGVGSIVARRRSAA